MKNNRRAYDILGVILLIIVVSGSIWKLNIHSKVSVVENPKIKHFQNDERGVGFDYQTEVNQIELTDIDKNDNFLFRGSNDTEPPYLISLRYEEGLRNAAQLSRTSTMELLLNNTDKAYPTRYPGYKKLSERQYDLNGKKASQVDFTYTGTDGKLAHQSLNIFLKDENTAYFLSLQSRESDSEQMKELFSRVVESFHY